MTICERCGRETLATIMSMFNNDIICTQCKNAERLHPAYSDALAADNVAIEHQDFNFPGIGCPPELYLTRSIMNSKDDYFSPKTHVLYRGYHGRVVDVPATTERFRSIIHIVEIDGIRIATTGRNLTHAFTHVHTEFHPDYHDPDCYAQLVKDNDARNAWRALYPNFCPACDGNGEFYTPATREEPENHEPCSLCSENGLCPRCGRKIVYPENRSCSYCNFSFGKRPDDYMPVEPECICWERNKPRVRSTNENS